MVMTLFNRYPGVAGVRLDVEHHPSHGRALDLGRAAGGICGPFSLWVRQHDNRCVTLDALEPSDLIALRDGINSLLAAEGVERQVTVNVSVDGEERFT